MHHPDGSDGTQNEKRVSEPTLFLLEAPRTRPVSFKILAHIFFTEDNYFALQNCRSGMASCKLLYNLTALMKGLAELSLQKGKSVSCFLNLPLCIYAYTYIYAFKFKVSRERRLYMLQMKSIGIDNDVVYNPVVWFICNGNSL